MLKFIGQMGSWSGIATTCRRQDSSLPWEEIGVRENRQVLFWDKYLMHTYQASVRTQVRGRSQVIKTEVRAMNAQDARWLLWAQWGFHSIQSGPAQVNTRWAA
ncbi:MAG: hypothetical protein EBT67_12325 [Betaproteobacteria bacterium]|nr:hypothetical protein [Betaproteobacteria bacterium]